MAPIQLATSMLSTNNGKKIVLSIREMWVCWCGRNKSVTLPLLCPICLQTPLSPLLQAFSTSASPWPLPTNAGATPLLPLISYCLMDHCSILPHCPSSFPCNLSASGLKSFVQLHFQTPGHKELLIATKRKTCQTHKPALPISFLP